MEVSEHVFSKSEFIETVVLNYQHLIKSNRNKKKIEN
jgi:hypothetical protein